MRKTARARFGVTRRTVIAAAALAARPTLAQDTPRTVKVVVQTGQGRFVVELDLARAPITAGNFLNYVESGRFDGASFYRASRSGGDPKVGLIEGGLQNDPAKLLPPIAHESTLTTGLAHRDGVVSMARDAPGTATADFFICCGPSSYLDARPGAPGDNLGYAAFGQVIEGMETVRAILALPTPGAARNPVMQGQMLDPTVPILQMRRV